MRESLRRSKKTEAESGDSACLSDSTDWLASRFGRGVWTLEEWKVLFLDGRVGWNCCMVARSAKVSIPAVDTCRARYGGAVVRELCRVEGSKEGEVEEDELLPGLSR